MKSTVSGLLNQKFKILEKVIMKAMRALKRKAVKSKSRQGFMFNQVKAEVRKVAKHKQIRNVVLIKALENLRLDGEILLKKGRNYLVKKKKSGKKSGKKVNKKKSKKARKSRRKRSEKSKNTPESHQKVSKFIKNHFKSKKQAKTSKKSAKSAKSVKKPRTPTKPKTIRAVKPKPATKNEISETVVDSATRRTVHPQKTDEEMNFYKQTAKKEDFSGDYVEQEDFKQENFKQEDFKQENFEQDSFVVSETEMDHFAEDILEEARRESRKELGGVTTSSE